MLLKKKSKAKQSKAKVCKSEKGLSTGKNTLLK
jgi:hypothetical protein